MKPAAVLLGIAAVFLASCTLPGAGRPPGKFEAETPRSLEECYALADRAARELAEERARLTIFGALHKTLQGGEPPMTKEQCRGHFRVPDQGEPDGERPAEYDKSRRRGGASGATGDFDYGPPGCRRLNHAVYPAC